MNDGPDEARLRSVMVATGAGPAPAMRCLNPGGQLTAGSRVSPCCWRQLACTGRRLFGGTAAAFAIRLALGAQRFAIVRLVLREAALLATWGLAAGLVGAVLAASAIRHEPFGVGSYDPITYGVAVPALLAAILTASVLPAIGAMRLRVPESLQVE